MEVILADNHSYRYFAGECPLGKPEFTAKRENAKTFTDVEQAIQKRKELLAKGYAFYIEPKTVKT